MNPVLKKAIRFSLAIIVLHSFVAPQGLEAGWWPFSPPRTVVLPYKQDQRGLRLKEAINRSDGTLNCRFCAISTALRLSGKNPDAHTTRILPHGFIRGETLKHLRPHFSQNQLEFSKYANLQELGKDLINKGNGAHAIVLGPFEMLRGVNVPRGHFFNLLNVDGRVRFIDSQRGILGFLDENPSYQHKARVEAIHISGTGDLSQLPQ